MYKNRLLPPERDILWWKVIDTSFLKKIQFPKFRFNLAIGPASFVGIDIGTDSVKVVQLRKERERAILETYGELKVARYFQQEKGGGGFLARSDEGVVNLLTDVLRESNVTTRRAVFGIPATSSFITVVHLPLLSAEEIKAAVPFEAKKYIPISAAEVTLDWQVLERDEEQKRVAVLLVAVPNEVIAKYRRIAERLGLTLEAMEVESFSLLRSLLGAERGTAALIHWGAAVTTVTVVDRRQIRMNSNFGRGAREITTALSRSLGITLERAEAMKREIGLSEKPEHREIAAIIAPLVDSTLADIERALANYSRTAKRKAEKIVLTGGGASLSGLVDHVARHFGLETVLANPFARTIFPAFLQPVLKDIAPNFSVAVGLALRQIATA
ncbi:MAG: type IV pilus assembly protein PilM [Candidatus Sungbacteria bacterium]|uniref:Type IV pilus assembly protein PilM n=1 Tax=Candidatus Sungiibacteriota bacterium TaxID=2750080 RepID=A0A933DRL2_9BACT|nr:type IV pilus assembly protein PilM [Candidatus Sungbacteria bacterium]